MECILQVSVITVLAATFFIWFFWKRIHNLPPGPLGLPIVGYAPFLGKYPYITLMNLSKKHGSMFTLPLGIKSVLVLNDWASVKETLVDQDEVFSGRAKNALVEVVHNYKDIFFSSGRKWRERRRFTLHHLRDFGFGKKSVEEVIMVEVNKILERLTLNPVADIRGFFYFSFMNVIWSMIGGKSFEIHDKYMLKFTDVLRILFKEFANSNLICFLPFLKYVPRILHKAEKASGDLYKFFDDEIDEHIKSYQKDNQRDFIDVFLKEIFAYQEQGIKTDSFTKDNLKSIMFNLFSAAIDTGSNTLSWALLYMITWPEIQKNVQAELDEIIGRSRLPTYSDKALLPYTEAVIQEVHRYASIVPLSVPHCTTTATTVRNYSIPKDTIVLENIWAVHHDPNLWGDPEVFRPERFLNSNGEVQKPEYLIPFSTGKRYCLGEPLARMELFLFFTTLLHKFSFSKPIGIPSPSLDPIVSITLGPKLFSLIASPRE